MDNKDIIDRPLKLDIKPNDCALIIVLKEALKGYTTVKFRKLFNDNEDKECKRMLRAIEHPPRGNISIVDFLTLIDRINIIDNSLSVMKKYNISRRSVGIKRRN